VRVRSSPRQQNCNMGKQRKIGSGGARPGAGGQKPLKYGEETVNLNIRVPKSKKAEIKTLVNKKLKTYIKKPKGKQ